MSTWSNEFGVVRSGGGGAAIGGALLLIECVRLHLLGFSFGRSTISVLTAAGVSLMIDRAFSLL